MNVDISCTARHRNSVCGQGGPQHIPKEIKFKIDRVTLKNWPRIWTISFGQNIAAFPTENQPGFSKAKAKSANVVMIHFPLHQKAVKAKLFFCSFLIEEMPKCQNCEQNGSVRQSEMQRPSIMTVSWLYFDQARKMFTYNWPFFVVV